MNGIDPYEYINHISIKISDIDDITELKEILDKLEYLYEVIPPELMEITTDLIHSIERKLNHHKT